MAEDLIIFQMPRVGGGGGGLVDETQLAFLLSLQALPLPKLTQKPNLLGKYPQIPLDYVILVVCIYQ